MVEPLPVAAALGGDVEHTLLLNYRGLRPLREVRAQIAQLEAALPSAVHLVGDDLEGGAGAQQACFVASSSLPRVLEAAIDGINDAAANEGTLTLKYEPNPGRSDASHLWRGLPEELRGERVVPLELHPVFHPEVLEVSTHRRLQAPDVHAIAPRRALVRPVRPESTALQRHDSFGVRQKVVPRRAVFLHL